MPAIDIGGKTYRTLADPIYLKDGRQVKEVWIRPNDTGTPVKVYPEKVTPTGIYKGTFVCKGKSTWVLDGFIKYQEKAETESEWTDIARQPYRVTLDFSYALSIDSSEARSATDYQYLDPKVGISSAVYVFDNIVDYYTDSTYNMLNYLEFYARYSFAISNFPDVELRCSPTATLENLFSKSTDYQTILSGFQMYGRATNVRYSNAVILTNHEFTMEPYNAAFAPSTAGFMYGGLIVNSTMTNFVRNKDTKIAYNYVGALQIPGLHHQTPSATYRNFEVDSKHRCYITDLDPPTVHADPL